MRTSITLSQPIARCTRYRWLDHRAAAGATAVPWWLHEPRRLLLEAGQISHLAPEWLSMTVQLAAASRWTHEPRLFAPHPFSGDDLSSRDTTATWLRFRPFFIQEAPHLARAWEAQNFSNVKFGKGSPDDPPPQVCPQRPVRIGLTS